MIATWSPNARIWIGLCEKKRALLTHKYDEKVAVVIENKNCQQLIPYFSLTKIRLIILISLIHIKIGLFVCMFVCFFFCLFVCFGYRDVIITRDGLQMLTYTRHTGSLSSNCSLACHTYCDTRQPFTMVISYDL